MVRNEAGEVSINSPAIESRRHAAPPLSAAVDVCFVVRDKNGQQLG